MKARKVIAIVVLASGGVCATLCAVGGELLLRAPDPVVRRRPDPIIMTNWQGGLVTDEGDFTTPVGLVLKTRINNNLVHVSLIDADGKTLARNSMASAYHRWIVYLDKSQRVWYYTGDMGIFIWVPKVDGSYAESMLDSSNSLYNKMPRAFYDQVGHSRRPHSAPTEPTE